MYIPNVHIEYLIFFSRHLLNCRALGGRSHLLSRGTWRQASALREPGGRPHLALQKDGTQGRSSTLSSWAGGLSGFSWDVAGLSWQLKWMRFLPQVCLECSHLSIFLRGETKIILPAAALKNVGRKHL